MNEMVESHIQYMLLLDKLASSQKVNNQSTKISPNFSSSDSSAHSAYSSSIGETTSTDSVEESVFTSGSTEVKLVDWCWILRSLLKWLFYILCVSNRLINICFQFFLAVYTF